MKRMGLMGLVICLFFQIGLGMAPVFAAEQMVTFEDADYYKETGRWELSPSITGFDGGKTRFSNGKGAQAIFTVPHDAAGEKEIFFYKIVAKSDIDKGRAEKAMPVEIRVNGQTVKKELDCSVGVSGWESLGTYSLKGDGTETITITTLVSTQWANTRVQAVKFVGDAEEPAGDRPAASPSPKRTDYAQGKTVFASNEYTETPADAAVDGDDGSQWRILMGDLQSYLTLTVDFAGTAKIDGARLLLYTLSGDPAAEMASIKIQYSDDLENWKDAFVFDGVPHEKEIQVSFDQVQGRYFRFYADKAKEKVYPGLYTFELYGPEAPVIGDSYENPIGFSVDDQQIKYNPVQKVYCIQVENITPILSVERAKETQRVIINGKEQNRLQFDLSNGVQEAAVKVISADGKHQTEFRVQIESKQTRTQGFELLFQDEFDGDQVNENEWFYRNATTTYSQDRKENVSVKDGMLKVDLKKENYKGSAYTSGGVISKKKFGYGYYETRAKVFTKPKWHTAFWMNGLSSKVSVIDGDQLVWPLYDNSINELDIFEIEDNFKVSQGIHTWWPLDFHKGDFRLLQEYGFDPGEDFHTYGCEWTPEIMKFYVDGLLVGYCQYGGPHQAGDGITNETLVTQDETKLNFETADGSAAYGRGINAWLTALISSKTTTPDDALLPAASYFDYFRYYYKDYGIVAPENAYLIDTKDEGYHEEGNWENYTKAFGYSDLNTRLTNSKGAKAIWTPEVPAGTYEVYLWNPSMHSASSKALAMVENGAETTTAVIDQVLGGQTWIPLGRYHTNGGTDFSISLTAAENVDTIADTVMLVPVESHDQPEEPLAPFTDLKGFEWAADSVDRLAGQGIIQGTGEGCFSPGQPVTRAEFAVLLTRAFAFNENGKAGFRDVESDAYYAKAVGTAQTLGIVKGDAENKFHPLDPVSRADLMTMLARGLEVKGIAVQADNDILSRYPDGNDVPDYARQAVALMVGNGYINGNESGELSPNSNASRAEIAVILDRVMNDID